MAVEHFVTLYGAEAGNFALKTFPTGGMFVAGTGSHVHSYAFMYTQILTHILCIYMYMCFVTS